MKKRLNFLVGLTLVAFVSFGQEIPVWKLTDLQTRLESSDAPTVLNFWATFCKPCIAELPHFQKLAAAYKARGVNFVFVSLDFKEAYPKKITDFRRKLKITEPVVFLDESNADLFCPAVDSSWTGSIPATLLFNPKNGYRQFFEEELSKEKLEAEIKKMLAIGK